MAVCKELLTLLAWGTETVRTLTYPSVPCRWSDTGARKPHSFGNDPGRAGYCRARLATMSGRFLQFAANEYTLYGGQDSPRDTFMCPELLNTIVVRCVVHAWRCLQGACG